MLYLPKHGHMWDPSILYYEGFYYLFSMFSEENEDCVNVWCAKSADGVFFEDVGKVIADREKPVWKMFVNRYHNGFVMNYGSFSGLEGHGNDTLKFFTSTDLLHWDYAGYAADEHPNTQWYCNKERFDHMYTLKYKEKWIGFVVATPSQQNGSKGCGLMESEDGLHWTPLPPVEIEWGDIPPINFEVGGCEKIGNNYYLIGGTYNHCGNAAYGVYSLQSENPMGPYQPCLPHHRLCGSMYADEWAGVQWLASFGRGADNEVLLTNYITAQTSNSFNFIGTKQNVWLLPIKKAVVDECGAVAMAYWHQNDLLRGNQLEQIASEILLQPGMQRYEQDILSAGNTRTMHWLGDIPANGLMMDADVVIRQGKSLNPACIGIVVGNEALYTALSIPVGDERYQAAKIWRVEDGDFDHAQCLDEINGQCAGRHCVTSGLQHHLRVLYRYGMVEYYLDDYLVQSYLVSASAACRFGVYAMNGEVCLSSIRAFEMKALRRLIA